MNIFYFSGVYLLGFQSITGDLNMNWMSDRGLFENGKETPVDVSGDRIDNGKEADVLPRMTKWRPSIRHSRSGQVPLCIHSRIYIYTEGKIKLIDKIKTERGK